MHHGAHAMAHAGRCSDRTAWRGLSARPCGGSSRFGAVGIASTGPLHVVAHKYRLLVQCLSACVRLRVGLGSFIFISFSRPPLRARAGGDRKRRGVHPGGSHILPSLLWIVHVKGEPPSDGVDCAGQGGRLRMCHGVCHHRSLSDISAAHSSHGNAVGPGARRSLEGGVSAD